MNEPITPTEATFVPETTPTDTTPPATPPADTTPPVNPNTATIHGTIPDHLKGVTLKDTFLPEDADELPPGKETAKTPEEIQKEKDAAAGKPAVTTPPATTTPPVTTTQPKTTQNEEIIDATKPDVLLAGKYKTIDELKHGIEELGGDPTGITEPKMLEQVYKTVQASFTKWQQRQQKAEELAHPPEAPKPFALTDESIKGMVDQIDFSKVEDMRDVAQQMFGIMFKEIGKNLPQMLPKQAPTMTPQEMAAQVEQVTQATDSLGFIEAKVPRLTTDKNFRDQFAVHLKNGKEKGIYPKIATRDSMVLAMKNFQKMLAEMAGVTIPDETAIADKGAAAVPDGGGKPQSTTTAPDPDEDILESILGAKKADDLKYNPQGK